MSRAQKDLKLWLSPEQEQLARRLLADGVCHRDVASAVGVTYRRLLTRILDQLAAAAAPDLRVGELCQEIRAGWTEDQRAERWHPLHHNFSGDRLPE